MSKTTQTRFQHCNSSDLLISYEEGFIIARKVSGKDDELEEEIYIDNDEIKRINKVINKNAREEN